MEMAVLDTNMRVHTRRYKNYTYAIRTYGTSTFTPQDDAKMTC